MRPSTFGRALGIGARLLGQRVLPPTPPPPSPAQAAAARERRAARGEALGRRVHQTQGGVRQGSSNFGRAVWNPFARAGGILWLEITGAFFLLFGVLFAQHLWSVRAAYRSGPEHGRFLMYAVLAGVFFYFAVSSFVRARRR